MFKRFKMFLIVCITISPFLFLSFGYARPPKPGPNSVWIKPHTTSGGVFVPGHWKYVGPPKKGKVWVPGHRSRNGKWIRGHWR